MNSHNDGRRRKLQVVTHFLSLFTFQPPAKKKKSREDENEKTGTLFFVQEKMLVWFIKMMKNDEE